MPQPLMVDVLVSNPLLLLFVVSAIGFLLGHFKIKGFSLGIAAVLFVGLGFGALDPKLALPEMIQTLGLVLFVYSVGISSGPGFFGSLRTRGLRANLVVLLAFTVVTLVTVLLAKALAIQSPHAAGVFAGALTNTPALAGVMDAIARTTEANDPTRLNPVVGYSITYPFGVLFSLAAIFIANKWFGPSKDDPPASQSYASTIGESIISTSVQLSNNLPHNDPNELKEHFGLHVIFGRVRRGEDVLTVAETTKLLPNDIVSIVGTPPQVQLAISRLGRQVAEHIEFDRTEVDYRRIFVSRPDVVERPLRTLPLGRRFGAVITRIRRGDIEFVPDDHSELELGDRVRVVAPREQMSAVSAFLGDSYKSLSEVDLVPFGVGIALGLLLGAIPIPLWGGASFRLGFAGGPLIIGLIAGKLGRTGPLVWTLPYSASLTLRQFGVVLFLAGVGTRSGWALATTLRSGGALPLLLMGAVVTVLTVTTILVMGKLMKIPTPHLLGIISGAQTQPADLAFALEQAKNEMPTVGYSSVYPLATIAKIVLAQVVLLLAQQPLGLRRPQPIRGRRTQYRCTLGTSNTGFAWLLGQALPIQPQGVARLRQQALNWSDQSTDPCVQGAKCLLFRKNDRRSKLILKIIFNKTIFCTCPSRPPVRPSAPKSPKARFAQLNNAPAALSTSLLGQ